MGYTRAQWARDFLRSIGNANPDPRTLSWVVSWTQYETSCCGGASYNLLNTTEPNTPGVVSNFNGVGVKNYANYADGIGANAKVLQNGLYPNLLAALRANNVAALGYGASTPNPGVMHDLSTWCGGCAYGNTFVSLGGSGANQVFGGNSMSVPTGGGGGGGSGQTTGQSPYAGGQGQTQTAPSGAAVAQCAPLDLGCALSNFWNLYLLPFLEHMLLFILAFILIIVGFILLGGPDIRDALTLKRAP